MSLCNPSLVRSIASFSIDYFQVHTEKCVSKSYDLTVWCFQNQSLNNDSQLILGIKAERNFSNDKAEFKNDGMWLGFENVWCLKNPISSLHLKQFIFIPMSLCSHQVGLHFFYKQTTSLWVQTIHLLFCWIKKTNNSQKIRLFASSWQEKQKQQFKRKRWVTESR